MAALLSALDALAEGGRGQGAAPQEGPWIAWSQPPSRRPLAPDDVHVWCVVLDRDEASRRPLAEVLAPDERVRADRFHFARDRGRFIVARGTLRLILAAYVDLEPSRIAFRYGPHGKPGLSHPGDQESLVFNLAHSGGLALVAVSRSGDLGVDLEELRPLEGLQRIAGRYFSAGEAAGLLALPPEQRGLAFFRCWTRKEAYLKATGEGLADRLDRFEVSLAPDAAPALVADELDPAATAQWSIYELRPAASFVGALAVKAKTAELRIRCWQHPLAR